MITEKCLGEQVARLLRLPFGATPLMGERDVKGRAAEFKRVLQAGLSEEGALSAVIDDLLEHCEECPAPAVVIDAIRRYNVAAIEARTPPPPTNAELRQRYGAPAPAAGDRMDCPGHRDHCKTWKEIIRVARFQQAALLTAVRHRIAETLPTGKTLLQAEREMSHPRLFRIEMEERKRLGMEITAEMRRELNRLAGGL